MLPKANSVAKQSPKVPTQSTPQSSLPSGKEASVLPEADGSLVRGDTRQSTLILLVVFPYY